MRQFITILIIIAGGIIIGRYTCVIRDGQAFSFTYYGMSFIILTIISLTPLILALHRKNYQDIINPALLFGVVTFLFWGLGSVLLMMNPNVLIIPSSVTFFPLVLLYTALAYMAFLIGYYAFCKRPSGVVSDSTGNITRWDPSVAFNFILLLVIITWWARVYFGSKGLMFSWALSNVWNLNFIEKSLLQFILMVQFMIVPSLMIVYYRLQGSQCHRRKFLSFMCVLTITVELVSYILFSQRTNFIWNLISIGIIAIAFGKKPSIKAVISIMFIFFFFISPFVMAMRLESMRLAIQQRPESHLRLVAYLVPRAARNMLNNYGKLLFETSSPNLSIRLSAIDLMAAVVTRAERNEITFLYGRTIIHSLPAFVPRIIWPGKPPIGGDDPENEVVNHFRLGIHDPMLTPITELYANFWIIGVLIGMFIYGRVVRMVYNLLVLNRKNDTGLVVYASSLHFLIGMQTSLVMGPFVGLRWIILMWLIAKVIELRNRSILAITALLVGTFVFWKLIGG